MFEYSFITSTTAPDCIKKIVAQIYDMAVLSPVIGLILFNQSALNNIGELQLM